MTENKVANIKPQNSKIILNLAGEIVPTLSKVFESFNCKLQTEMRDNEEIDYILVRDVKEGYKSLAEKYQTVKFNIPIISLIEVVQKEEFFAANGRGWVSEALLSIDQFLETFERFFNQTSSMYLEDVYSNLQYKTEVIKLTGHMNVGHYMDIISHDAMNSGFNVINFRKYFLSAVTYMSYLHSSNIGKYPLDVDYMIKKDRLDLQIYCNVESFYLEYLKTAMRNPDRQNPLRGILSECFHSADFLDLYHLVKASKLVLCASFLKDEALNKKENYFPSMFLNEITSFKQFQAKEKERLISIKLSKNENTDLTYLENSTLPGEGVDVCQEKRLRDDAPLFEKVVADIKAIREKEEIHKEAFELSAEDIETYLKAYPDQDEISFVNIHDHEDILTALINSIEYVLSQEKDSKISGTDHIKDSYTRISGTKEQKESMFIIRGSKKENDKGNMRVLSLGEGKEDDQDIDHEHQIKSDTSLENATEIFEKRIEHSKQNYEKRIQNLLRELEETRLQVRNTALDKAEIDKLTRENNDYKNSLETSMKRIEILSDKLDKIQGGKQGSHSMPQAKSEDDLSSADDALRKQYNKIKREWEDRTVEVKRLELVNRQLEGEIKKLNGQLEKSVEAQSDAKEGDVKVRAMEIELKNLKVEVSIKDKTVQALTQKNKALSDQMGRILEESKTARPVDNGKLAKMENRMKQVDTANQNLTKERDALKKEIADKKKDVVVLQKENQTLRNQNQELERKLKVEKSKQAA